ncbi:MAG: aminotransferase class III-fold pyridoxal phosphate-dependent enzyme [candidate division Zixibacteria bacterium]|nr:aminotransferase class III-fold pyridoxal phosphate-dependent enzyme [candidate division Zixibacteria bacterium]
MGFSTQSDEEILELSNSFGATHYGRYDFIVRKSESCWLYDHDGNKYLDCLAAYSAANQGHHHPGIVQAVVDGLQKHYGSVVSNMVHTDAYALFAEKLAALIPQLAPRFGQNGNKVLVKNGGVESVETALKFIRYYGYKSKGIEDGKQEIIVFHNNFHGRMIAVVSFSTTPKYKEGFGPLTPGFVSVEYGNLDAVKNAINENTCGILVEPMQGEGGMYQPPEGFLKGLRQLADDNDLMLIFDEIQVGLGRTGKMFCFEHENVIPDGLVLGKALSGGLLPVSAFVANTKLMDLVFRPGSDGSTFGGYPLGAIAGIAALDVIVKEGLSARSAEYGKILRAKIDEIAEKSSHVKEVRGRGLFIGLEVVGGDAMKYCRKLLELGVLANDSHGHTIRISPPLVITKDEIDYLVERLEKVLLD